MGKKPIEKDGYKCITCGECSEDQDDIIEEIELWQCVDCDELHDNKEDAYHCCE